VRERDYFFVVGFSVWGLISGIGLAGLWKSLSRSLGSLKAASPVLVLALVPLFLNLERASREGDYSARDWAYDLLNSVEPYAVLFTNGDNDTFPLWYLQEVEGVRRDVTVVVGQYLYTDWYPRQIRELTQPDRQRPYVPVEGSPHEDRDPPAGPVLTLPDDQLALFGDGPLPDSFGVPIGGIFVQYPPGMSLGRGHRIALAMIRDSAPERPIYFAGTGGEMAELALSSWGVREGLAARLHVRNVDGPRPSGYRRAPPEFGGEWFDYPRTVELLDEVYAYRGLRHRPIWQDMSTESIPLQYHLMTNAAAAIAIAEGDGAAAERYSTMAREFLVVYEGGEEGRRSR